MKLKEFLNSRVVLYLLHTGICFASYKIFGFELMVIIGIGQIFGELHYQEKR